ncbi:mATE domain protein [Clostridium sp. CAG:413]|nr:mATE domain protein [Clostridium sp. CAG:413]
MKKPSPLLRNTIIMPAVNMIMRSVSVGFNAYLTSRIGSQGIGLFQLVMTVYSLAVTFSCAGMRLASMRMTVESASERSTDRFMLCAMGCGCTVGVILYTFADIISLKRLGNACTAPMLRILAFALPFTATSSVLGGYFTAKGMILPYSCIQLIEQGIKTLAAMLLIRGAHTPQSACTAVITAMVVSEALSFLLSFALKKSVVKKGAADKSVRLKSFFRIALPDAAGTCVRSILLTVEHLLIPKGFERSGEGSSAALAAYGNIHGMALPLLLYPSAALSSLSALLIPELARRREACDKSGISLCVERNLRRTLIFACVCAGVFAIGAPAVSNAVYHSDEAVLYIRILSPLVPIMYTDMVTDGMLKGLDQQVHSMNYNMIDSALCVILVAALLPKYSVKGYIFILYFSEILNFYLSLRRLLIVCEIRVFRGSLQGNPKSLLPKKCSISPRENGSRSYRGLSKRSRGLSSCR